MSIVNIHKVPWVEATNDRGERWKSIDLSGERLGVRIEELPPGGSSSVHHYHTQEEEHVLVLEGSATLILGSAEIEIEAGDHAWFPAGREEAHHLENRSSGNFRFLVFGERLSGDVVFYPDHQVALVKALGWKQVTYRERTKPDEPEAES